MEKSSEEEVYEINQKKYRIKDENLRRFEKSPPNSNNSPCLLNCRNNLEFSKEQVEYLTYSAASDWKIDFDQPLITGDYEDWKSGYGNTKRGFL